MRRLFIIRKDLHLTPGKLSAMIAHCAEAYWTNLMKSSSIKDNEYDVLLAEDPWHPGQPAIFHSTKLCELAEEAFKAGQKTFKAKKLYPKKTYTISVDITKDIWEDYVNDIFTKTICEARNLNQLKKAETIAKEIGLVENRDYGFINDCCKTELTAENPDGTCTVGIWFKPLADDIAHQISKKFPLYRS